jgi:hypothetical protein
MWVLMEHDLLCRGGVEAKSIVKAGVKFAWLVLVIAGSEKVEAVKVVSKQ